MDLKSHIKNSSISSDTAFLLLDKHKKEFAGIQWMPKNFFQRQRIVFMLNKVTDLYKDIEIIDFTNMPGEHILTKAKYQMWLDLRLAIRWQVKDHMKFLEYLNEALKSSRTILEKLRTLMITNQLTRNIENPSFFQPNLLD